MFGLGKKDIDDEEDGNKIIKEPGSNEFKYMFILIISVLFALFAISLLMNISTVTKIDTSTNNTLVYLNSSAEQTLTVMENNSNQTDAKIINLANITTINTNNIGNNTKNIKILTDYIKGVIDKEVPEQEAFERNVTALIKNVSHVVNELDKSLHTNYTGKIVENHEFNKEQIKLLKQIKISINKLAVNTGVIINSNVGMNGTNSTS